MAGPYTLWLAHIHYGWVCVTFLIWSNICPYKYVFSFSQCLSILWHQLFLHLYHLPFLSFHLFSLPLFPPPLCPLPLSLSSLLPFAPSPSLPFSLCPLSVLLISHPYPPSFIILSLPPCSLRPSFFLTPPSLQCLQVWTQENIVVHQQRPPSREEARPSGDLEGLGL